MRDDEFKQFSALLVATYDLMGKTPAARVISPGSQALFFNAVKHYTLEQVSRALTAHCREGTFTPVPNDIKVQVEKHLALAWVSADEAWATAPKLESDAGVINQVVAAALAVAQQLIDSGDMVAARRAFIDAYNARVEQAKAHPDPAQRVPVTFVSGGNLPQRHQDAHGERVMLLERAQSVGLLPGTQRQQIAAPHANAGPPPEFKALLLNMKAKTMPKPEREDYEN